MESRFPNWEWILSRDPSRRPRITVVETWNELHEGTEIAETREWGRQYIQLTRKYADLWRAGAKLERPGAYGRAKEVRIKLGKKNVEEGIVQRESADGKTISVLLGEKEGRTTVRTKHAGRYIYLDVDDGFYYDGAEPLEVEFEFFESGAGSILFEYDSSDRAAPHSGAFKQLPPIALDGSKTWKRSI